MCTLDTDKNRHYNWDQGLNDLAAGCEEALNRTLSALPVVDAKKLSNNNF